MRSMRRPIILTYCQKYSGSVKSELNSIMGELVNNRSDFSANIMEVNYNWYQNTQFSPTFFFGNAITILSGKILANNANGLSILSSFPLNLWLTLCAIFVVIAICNRILHKHYSKFTLYLVDVLDNFIKLCAVFINQSNQFANICCVKHLILNSVTVISIFVMTLYFTSEILSNLLIQPLIKIDTLDDLVKYINQNPNVKLISDNMTSSFRVMKKWDDERAKFVYPRLTSVPYTKFDYKQVYHGKSIIITFDSTIERMLKYNPDLYFHMSVDRLFGFQYGLIYSKYIDIKTKLFINSITRSLFESGIYNFMRVRKGWKHLELEESDPPQTISISYFKKVMLINIYSVILLILILIVEVLVFNSGKIIFTWILHFFISR